MKEKIWPTQETAEVVSRSPRPGNRSGSPEGSPSRLEPRETTSAASLILCLLLLSVLASSACQKKAATPEEAGKVYFSSLGCEQCHAVGNVGGTYGPNLTFIGFRKSPQWLDTWLKNPHEWRSQTVMPNFHFSDDVRAALVAYLSAQKGQAWDKNARPWNAPEFKDSPVKRGEVVFNMAGCVACHGQDGKGGYPNNNAAGGLIPSLTHVAEGYSLTELETKIREGVPQPASADLSQPAPMVYMPSWGKVLSEDEIAAVAQYLTSLGQGAKAESSGGF